MNIGEAIKDLSRQAQKLNAPHIDMLGWSQETLKIVAKHYGDEASEYRDMTSMHLSFLHEKSGAELSDRVYVDSSYKRAAKKQLTVYIEALDELRKEEEKEYRPITHFSTLHENIHNATISMVQPATEANLPPKVSPLGSSRMFRSIG